MMSVRREGKEKQELTTSDTSFQFISRSREVILTSKRRPQLSNVSIVSFYSLYSMYLG
ncbi:hypothetical protein V6Z11_D04G121300 [Gossypium hirsutum]